MNFPGGNIFPLWFFFQIIHACLKSFSFILKEHCTKLCPLECNRTSFVYHVTEVDILGGILTNYINENENLKNDFLHIPINSETAKQSVVRLSIFSDSLSYSLSTEAPKMDIVSLFANIGGNLGLFLNIGFFSLGEIFVILIEMFYVFKKENKNESVQPKIARS